MSSISPTSSFDPWTQSDYFNSLSSEQQDGLQGIMNSIHENTESHHKEQEDQQNELYAIDPI